MRVAIVAESFLPQVNGVTNSVLRVLEHLRATGHEAIVFCPSDDDVPDSYEGFPVVPLQAVGLPFYADVKVGLSPSFHVENLLLDWRPDVVHLAAPFALGYSAVQATARHSIPSVAVYQTEVPSYASSYGWTRVQPLLWRRVRQIHELATLTLAPSTPTAEQLVARRVPRVHIWARGVDAVRFHPARRDPAVRVAWGVADDVVVGYMGRLAPEKQVGDLAVLGDVGGARVVVVGDGPSRAELEQALPEAVFLGRLGGDDLPRAVASFDVFVHPGELETFGQSIQEALACGVPVVAPCSGGPIDLVRPDETGFLYPPGDLGRLRDDVARLVADEALRQRMGAAARASVQDRTWPHVCEQLLGHYRTAMRLLLGGDVELV